MIWEILKQYGISVKYIRMFKLLYEGYNACIEHEGEWTDSIEVSSGVYQGCILSPLLIIIVVDWIMRKVATNQ